MNALPLRGAECECTGCGERFSRERAFDRHRYGPPHARRCLSVETMTAQGWRRNARGCWVTDRLDAAGMARIGRVRQAPLVHLPGVPA